MAAANAEPSTSYLLDKLQSLSGVIPIGAFLAEHFWSNSYALVSVEKYNETSRELQTIPWRLPVEFLVIWLPLLFHGVYGIYIWWSGKSSPWSHPWMANWLYTLQRWSGIVAFVFIGWHLYTERWLTQGRSTYADVAASLRHPCYLAFYVLGVVASSFHLGNGLWNFCCKWGIAVSPRAQKMAGWMGVFVAVTFSLVGIAIVVAFRTGATPFQFYTLKGQ
jgi:succinate dehydrogenase / fumarate reductase, cytochrome b subunit